MLFNSLQFLFAFLPITYVVFWRLSTRNQRYVWLTLASYVFYGAWNYRFCAVMAFSTFVSYLAGRGLLAWHDPLRRRLCLIVPIVIDLSLLGFFKYTNFLLSNTQSVLANLGFNIELPVLAIVLPIGISFYTFHTISYMIDSYRGTITPTRNIWEYSCYVSLFSQLVAGPIVRFKQIEQDLEQIDRAERVLSLNRAWSFFVIGMIEKVLIADSIASIIDPALKSYTQLSTFDAWLCMLGYTYQIYFDFAGYSNMAVGLGAMFGLHIPQNFNSPYKATDPADFWRRWHISLSTCMRDYLYIPLGGSRGRPWLTYRNLLLTMLIGGLWHGASWTFVVWGGYHGVLLAAFRLASQHWTALPVLLRRAATFFLVVLGWVFFRSDSFEMASRLFQVMFAWRPGVPIVGAATLVGLLGVAALLAHVAPNAFELKHTWSSRAAVAFAVLFGVCLVVLLSGVQSPFLYFQF